LKFSHAARAQEAPQPTKMSNIAQSLPRKGAPIDAATGSKGISRYHPRDFRRSATSAAALQSLISLGLVAIAVPSMANESATGMADTCP
jgi:hypothetical protein